jgi:hypothetical protein
VASIFSTETVLRSLLLHLSIVGSRARLEWGNWLLFFSCKCEFRPFKEVLVIVIHYIRWSIGARTWSRAWHECLSLCLWYSMYVRSEYLYEGGVNFCFLSAWYYPGPGVFGPCPSLERLPLPTEYAETIIFIYIQICKYFLISVTRSSMMYC